MCNFKKIFFFVGFSLFFFSCNKGKEATLLANNESIATLLIKANNFKFKKESRLEYADRALENIKTKKNDSITRNNYYLLAGIYFDLGVYKKSNRLYQEMSLNSKLTNDILGIAKSNYCLGYFYYDRCDIDSAYYYFTKSEKAYKQIKDNIYLGRVINSKSNILNFKKDFSGSEVLAVRALKLGQKNKDYLLIYNCYITLGNALKGINDNGTALEYYSKAYQTLDNLKSEPQYILLKAQASNYIGGVYQKKKEFGRAMSYFKDALKQDDFRKNNIVMYCYLTNNLAYSKFKTGDKSCLAQFKEVLKIADSLNNIPIQVSCKINLSEYYLAQNDTTKALLNSNEAQQQAHNTKIFEDELKSLELLAKIDPIKGSFYNERYIKLTDSLQSNERATRDKFARIEFETDEIVNQKNDIETEKDEISLQRWLILGFGLLLLLLGISLYYSTAQRTKNKELQFVQEQQKANEEIYRLMLDQQQKIEEGKQIEKKRMSQELHDGVMGRLAGIRLNLFILTKKTDTETINRCLDYINQIQSVEKEIRTIAHDLNKNFFSGDTPFVNMVKNLFTAIETHSVIIFELHIEETIDWEKVSNNSKMQIYRIVQEALQNIDKYAKAKRGIITMIKTENTIAIAISDDGMGFDIRKIKSGIGLKNMHARMQELGGKINIQSQAGKGTQINLTIPI